MNNLAEILQHGLFYGAIVSAMMTVFIFGSLYLNPELWLHDAPPEVQAKFGPMSAKVKRQRMLWATPMFVGLIALLIWSIVQLRPITGGELPFIPVFLSVLVTMMTFNLWDLLIIDWLVVVAIQPKWIILPGTEGMAAYNDYGFHWRAFCKGTVGIVIASAVIAGVVSMIPL
jgi:hypothetical protein